MTDEADYILNSSRERYNMNDPTKLAEEFRKTASALRFKFYTDEVTEEMLEAGLGALWMVEEDPIGAVQEIFRVMLEAREKSNND